MVVYHLGQGERSLNTDWELGIVESIGYGVEVRVEILPKDVPPRQPRAQI